MDLKFYARLPDEIVFIFNKETFFHMFSSFDNLSDYMDFMVYQAKLYKVKIVSIEYRDYESGTIHIKSLYLGG